MRRILALSAVYFIYFIGQNAAASDFYVSSKTGDNTNPGTKEQPFKNIERGVKDAKTGDVIHVAEGNYFGLRDRGMIEIVTPVTLLGGYAPDFSKRDPAKHPTLIQPTNASAQSSRKALMILKSSKASELFQVDGFVFDMGMRNSYDSTEGKPDGVDTGALLLPPKYNKTADKFPTVTEQCLFIENAASEGDVVVQNNVFANCANFGIQGGHKKGTFKVLNNVFVANRMAAIEIFGTGGKKGPSGPLEKDGDVEIAYNTILFTWSRLNDFQDMGYGVRVMTMLGYHIHHNIIAANILTAVDHTRFNKNDWVKIEDNVIFANKQGDLLFAEPGKVEMERVKLEYFGDLGLASAKGNTSTALKMPIVKAYLEGYLAARYSEDADFDPSSPANLFRDALGLPKQGKLSTKVTMYANRYPYEQALKLFGAAKGVGAQKQPGQNSKTTSQKLKSRSE